MKRLALIVLVNFVVLATLVFTINLASIAGTQIYRSFLAGTSTKFRLPNYEGRTWAQQHFREFGNLKTRYFAFHGWRRTPYNGQTMTINQDGVRKTYFDLSADPNRAIAFFGGSTMWGTGADDERTIPSYFAKMAPDYRAYNFGETAYTARQSLNYLMKKIAEGQRFDVVVFYDGVNDVFYKCRRELGAFSHAREVEIRNILDRTRGWQAYLAMVQPLVTVINKLVERKRRAKGADDTWFDCDDKKGKIELVARSMLTDWLAAKLMVETYGGRFLSILQPVAYVSKAKIDHIYIDPEIERQYESVYPEIIRLLMTDEFETLQDNVLDLRTAFDRDEYIFIDYCHVSPNGNEIIASYVNDRLAEKPGDRLSAGAP